MGDCMKDKQEVNIQQEKTDVSRSCCIFDGNQAGMNDSNATYGVFERQITMNKLVCLSTSMD